MKTTNSPATASSITEAPFGETTDGTPVTIYTLRNRQGMEARIMNYGGIVVSLRTADKNGNFTDVVLGYDTLASYIKRNPFFGALVGRYGNRIANAKCSLDGKEYAFAVNNGPNHLHGGLKGFDKVVWKSKTRPSENGPELQLDYLSKDGEEGYPGNLTVRAVYTLTEDNALRLDFTATTDKPTFCNLTHHSYFNLRGGDDVLGYLVQINADKFTAVRAGMIPTGELRLVDGTPFDFRQSTAIGSRIDAHDDQLKIAGGYDHNWVLHHAGGELGLAARVIDPETGRILEAYTTEPGIQFYTGNFLDSTMIGKGGIPYHKRSGFCLEPQHFPDSPNHPHFPSVVLRPGETYKNTILYRFSAQ